MPKTVLFFPGQGSQYVGMARELYESSAEVQALYDQASNEIGADISRISFEGPADELKRTRFTQPAILLHSLAVLTLLKRELPRCEYAAGHSLGEYGALAVAGALTFADAIRAVVRRAALMEEACQQHPSTMAAIIGLDASAVEQICQEAAAAGVVVPANFNSSAQIVISGAPAAVEEALRLARAAGAKRALPLDVGGAFHSPLMESACEGMRTFLDQIPIRPPEIPVVANVTGQPVTDPGQIRPLLVQQITAPVRWHQTMTWLAQDGVSTVIEIGPGKVLSSLAKRDMQPERVVTLDTLENIETFAGVAV